MSTNEVNDLESKIFNNLNRLEEDLSQKNEENSLNIIRSIIDDLNERDINLNN